MKFSAAVLSLFFVWCLMVAQPLWGQSGKLNEAYTSIQKDLEENPGNLNRQMDLAYLYTQGLEYNRAAALYEAVVTKEPKNQRALIELCFLYTQIQDEVKALSMCQKAVATDPQNAVLHDNLGLSLFKFGKFAESFKPFSQALTLEPQSALIRGHMAESMLAMKEFKMARNYYTEILTDKTIAAVDRVILLNGLYRAHWALGDYQNAYSVIREANALAGNSVFLGMVVRAFLKVHEQATFFVTAIFLLLFCHYFGQRVNRFLKNEV